MSSMDDLWNLFWRPGTTIIFGDATTVAPVASNGQSMKNSGVPFDDDQIEIIEQAMKEVFYNSPYARKFWLGSDVEGISESHPLVILQTSFAESSEGVVGQYTDGKYYISTNLETSLAHPSDAEPFFNSLLYVWNSSGELVPYQLPLVIAHELFHALKGDPAETFTTVFSDQNSTANIQPVLAAVDANIVATEMGLNNYQVVSYEAQLFHEDPRFGYFNPNVSYSDGNTVDTVWVAPRIKYFLDFRPPFSPITDADILDMGTRTDNILAFGLDGNDRIRTGSGNDYIYGGDGNDRMVAGLGFNRIDGGAGSDTLVLTGSVLDYVFGAASHIGRGYEIGIILRSGDKLDLANTVEAYEFSDGTFSFADLISRSTILTGALGSAGTQQSLGMFTFDVADALGAHNFSVAMRPPLLDPAMTIPASVYAQLEIGFALNPHDSVGSGLGYAEWSFSTAGIDLTFLGLNQTLSIQYDVQITGTDGVVINKTVTEVITGDNDAPVIASFDKTEVESVLESAGISASAVMHGVAGTIHFADLDLADRPTASIAAQDVAYSGTLSAAQMSAFKAGFSLAPDSGNTNEGSVGWHYAIGDNALDFLGAGETLTVITTVKVDDLKGGFDTATVSVVLTGTNDLPTISALPDASATQNSGTLALGLLAGAADLDRNDVMSVVSGSLAIVSSDHRDVVFILSGDTLTVDPSQFSDLGAGQTVTLAYGYSATDGHATVYNTGSITITGVNDAPTGVVWGSGGTVPENSANGSVVGNLRGLDLDANDSFTWTLLDGAGGRFSVSAAGVVTVADGMLLDYETATGHDIVVRATDSGGLTYDQTVHIDLTDQAGVTLTGTAGNDVLIGTPEQDWLSGLGGSDTIYALGGNDLVLPGLGVNHSDGGDGVDTLSYSNVSTGVTVDLQSGTVTQAVAGGSGETAVNFENFIGTAAADTIWGTTGNNRIETGAGNDTIRGRGGIDYIDGGAGYDYAYFDYLTAAMSVDMLAGTVGGALAGTTLLNVEAVYAGSGNDTLTARNSGSLLDGGAGNDIIRGGTGADTLNGGDGDDFVTVRSNSGTANGGADNDTIAFENFNGVVVDLQAGTINTAVNRALNFENVIGTSASDTVTGTIGANRIETWGGNDVVYSRAGGTDYLDGGDGIDRLIFDQNTASQPIIVDLLNGTIGGSIAGFTVISFESITGGSGNDVFTAGNSGNSLFGGAGNDVLYGGLGNDTLSGGVGHDTIYGSLGADNIYDEDDVVIDYSSSNAAVAIGIDSNRYYMRGAGGYAQGDMISLASYSAKNEWLLTPFADTLETLYNNTTVHAGAGNDNITMGTLGTIVYGEDGYDIIAVGLAQSGFADFGSGGGFLNLSNVGGASIAFDWSDPGATSYVYSYSGSTLRGTISVAGDFGAVTGTNSADRINGNSEANVINGGGSTGYDIINGNDGDDTIRGYGLIHGGEGSDTITVDFSFQSGGLIFGDGGDDNITSTAVAASIYGGSGLNHIQVVYGTVYGGVGQDVISASLYAMVSYQNSDGAIRFEGSAGVYGDAADDTLIGVSKLTGTNHGDTFVGTNFELHLGTGNNTVTANSGIVYGNVGNDAITGSAGGDTIYGGGGQDAIAGGAGNDTIFLAGSEGSEIRYGLGDGLDYIYNFTQGPDSIGIRTIGASTPVVTLSQVNNDTDVHIRWYATVPIAGEDLPAHQDADILLKNVHLTSFVAGQDWHTI